MADLPIILNLSEQIPALRRVRALDQLLMLDLPPLAVGETLSGELRLCDGDGAIVAESGAVGYAPRILVSYYGESGQVALSVVTDFTLITDDPKGWSFVLPMLTQALVSYLGTNGQSKEAVFEIFLVSAGKNRLLYRRAVTLLAPVGTNTMATPGVYGAVIVRSDINTAQELRDVAVVDAILPVVYLTLEADGWNCWTLRLKADGEIDDGTTLRIPTGSTTLIWVKTSIM